MHGESPAMDGDSQPWSRVARDSGEKSRKIFSPLDVDWVGLDFRSADWSIQWPMVTLSARAQARRVRGPAGASNGEGAGEKLQNGLVQIKTSLGQFARLLGKIWRLTT